MAILQEEARRMMAQQKEQNQKIIEEHLQEIRKQEYEVYKMECHAVNQMNQQTREHYARIAREEDELNREVAENCARMKQEADDLEAQWEQVALQRKDK